MRRSPLAVLGLLVLFAALALGRSAPTPSKSADAPPTEFSATRAKKMLADVLGDEAPHPVGTAAHETVRIALVKRLESLGYSVEQRRGFGCSAKTCAFVTNLLARLPGKVEAESVLLAAHYDSVPAGPGASDDGIGVATVLEVARALKAAPTLRRPVWILVTDGEELGLLGARAFVEDKSLLSQVGVVVNVEARGTSGPSLMFETSPKNEGLVQNYARGTEHPVASSIFPTVYAMMPNDTDLSVFKRAGLPGLNYAVVGGAERYHTPRDDLAHADVASLQHHGDNVLAVVRSLAEGRDRAAGSRDAVFFDVLGAFVVRWPASVSGPVGAACLLASVVLVTMALRRKKLHFGPLVLALAGFVAVPVSGGLTFALLQLLRLMGAPKVPWVAHPAPYLVLSMAMGVGIAGTILSLFARRAPPLAILASLAILTSGVGTALGFLLPGFSFLYLVPAAAAALAFARLSLGPEPEGWGALAWPTAVPLAAIVVTVAPLGMLYDALGTPALSGIAVGVAFLTWSAAPLWTLLEKRSSIAISACVAASILVCGALAIHDAPFTPDDPEHVSVRTYSVDGAAPKGLLLAADGAPKEMADLFPHHESAWPWNRTQGVLASDPLPEPPEPPPEIAITEPRSEGSSTVTLRIRSTRDAPTLGIAFPPGARVAAWTLHETPMPLPAPVLHRETDWSNYECVGAPEGGVDVTLELRGGGPLRVLVYDRKPGVPIPRLVAARPPWALPYGLGDESVVAKTVEL